MDLSREHFARPPKVGVSKQDTHHPSITQEPPQSLHTGYHVHGGWAVPFSSLCLLLPLPHFCKPLERTWGGGGRAFSSIRKHLFHLDSCLSRRRASGTGCPRGDCTERRLMPAESHLMPWSPVSYPVQHQDSDYFLAKSAQGHD